MYPECQMKALYKEVLYLSNEESVMGMGAMTFVADVGTHSKQDQLCQVQKVPLTGDDHFEQESTPSPDSSHSQ